MAYLFPVITQYSLCGILFLISALTLHILTSGAVALCLGIESNVFFHIFFRMTEVSFPLYFFFSSFYQNLYVIGLTKILAVFSESPCSYRIVVP